MNNLNSKTTRSVAAVALLAGSFFATNASAASISQTSCSVSDSARNCVSPNQINLGNRWKTKSFSLSAFVSNYSSFRQASGTVRVFTVVQNKTLYQARIYGSAYEDLKVDNTAHIKVEIRDFTPITTADRMNASIVRS